MEQIVNEYMSDAYCSIQQKISIAGQVYGAIRGFGLLDRIINDDTITEVMINGPDRIFIEQNGRLYKLDSILKANRIWRTLFNGLWDRQEERSIRQIRSVIPDCRTGRV